LAVRAHSVTALAPVTPTLAVFSVTALLLDLLEACEFDIFSC